MYFEVNCKQKVICIQYSQRVLYVHARRVLSIYTCMSFILRETRTTVREWACCVIHFLGRWWSTCPSCYSVIIYVIHLFVSLDDVGRQDLFLICNWDKKVARWLDCVQRREVWQRKLVDRKEESYRQKRPRYYWYQDTEINKV